MSYIDLGYRFLNYFIDAINVKHQNLIGVLKNDTQLSVNTANCIGAEQFIYQMSGIGIHQLKIDPKYVIIQPIYWKNAYRTDYDGIMILASGSANLIDSGHLINKNIHFSFILENVNGLYYINNLIIRMSEKSRNIQQINYNPYLMHTQPMHIEY